MGRAIARGAVLWIGSAVAFAAAPARHVPTVDDLLNVPTVGAAQISPDGARVAYTVTSANFKEDAFVSQIWVANAATGETLQITRGDKSSTSPRWSPDGQWIAFLSNRIKDKNQVFAISVAGGEAAQLTKSETAINSFAWSPDGKTIAFAAPEPDAQAKKDRKEHLAEYEVVRGDYAFAHLFTLDVAEALKAAV
ncbi:MAG TPA: DPP IV N-terminal domain-containing protein, partial [Thermoanaerobaculia bacterium]|nr:DPP IV N-terminal domain-containing protein [Thermoanaerobaculia bacterium]